MYRTPFTKPMPEYQASSYAQALVKHRFVPELPYTMEAWYLRKKGHERTMGQRG